MKLSSKFQPVKTRRTVQDQVYDQLREALVSGAFEAGQGFTIPALAEKFMTSHMPVREALRRLAAENALQISSTGTAVVPHLDSGEWRKICEVRLILEPCAAEIAFGKMEKTEIEELKALLQAHKEAVGAGDIIAMLAANRAFHFRIYDASNNDVLSNQIENLWLRSGAYVRYLSDRTTELLRSDYRSNYTTHHDDMIAALEVRDVARFRAAMYDDVVATRNLVERFLSDGSAT